ncbi:ROK family protein [Candidatus Saccharibacteria bacterium]|nr:ROK family protein [Candidatus Saccharibacteria bacterium]
MFLAVDIGGTKTLVATFTNGGKLSEQVKFKTPKQYPGFISQLQEVIEGLSDNKFKGACVALPGRIDRENGIGLRFGNLPWKNVHVKDDLKKFLSCSITVDNDANLAGLSEARNVINDYKHVLYVTISTGIGTGIITDGNIDPDFAISEPGHMMVQYHDRMQMFEDIAAGSAIVKRYGKIAADINDQKTWKEIVHIWALGFNAMIATINPEVIIIGGGVGTHFKKYGKLLKDELEKYSTPLTPVPPIIQAKHAEQAVIYGCYHLAKDTYEKSHR